MRDWIGNLSRIEGTEKLARNSCGLSGITLSPSASRILIRMEILPTWLLSFRRAAVFAAGSLVPFGCVVAMALFDALLNLLTALLQVVVTLGSLILPWAPLIAWAGFWGLAVNWQKLSPVIRSGGFLGVVLIAFLTVLVWGSVAPPIDGFHYYPILGVKLSLSNFVGKLVYVVGLVVIMFLAGSAQLSGVFDGLVDFSGEDVVEEEDHGHDSHGHGEILLADAHH